MYSDTMIAVYPTIQWLPDDSKIMVLSNAADQNVPACPRLVQCFCTPQEGFCVVDSLAMFRPGMVPRNQTVDIVDIPWPNVTINCCKDVGLHCQKLNRDF